MNSNTVANDEEIKRAEQARTASEAQRISDLQAIIDMPEGRRFLNRLMFHSCHMFTGGGFQPSGSQMYYNSGARSVGFNIKEQIEEASPQAFNLILNEEL